MKSFHEIIQNITEFSRMVDCDEDLTGEILEASLKGDNFIEIDESRLFSVRRTQEAGFLVEYVGNGKISISW